MAYCMALPNIITLQDFNGDPNKYEEYLYYEIFLSELYTNKLIYESKEIGLRRYPEFEGKEDSFFHLTCKNFNGSKSNDERLPDLRRCERLGWIKPSIETKHDDECNQKCFYIYDKKLRGKVRKHFLNSKDRYMIVLEDRGDYWLLVTAYYIEYDNTLNRKIKEYENYQENKQKAPL